MGRQLESYIKPGLSVQYTYNDQGIRTSKTVNGVRTDYYLNGNQVIAEVTGSNRIDYRYDGNSKPVALRYNGAEYYYVTNIQGDVIGLTDANGIIVVQYTYDAWGNLTSCFGLLASSLGSANPYKYRGYWCDNESFLYYLESRYYDASVNRFINHDDINILINNFNCALGRSQFQYCNNNSVNYYDPTGYLTWPGQIHQIVQSLIAIYITFQIGKMPRINYYVNFGKWYSYGYADLYSVSTKEVWEVKPNSQKNSKRAIDQLNKYIKYIPNSRAGRDLGNFTVYFDIYMIKIYSVNTKGMIYYDHFIEPKLLMSQLAIALGSALIITGVGIPGGSVIISSGILQYASVY